MNLHDIESSDLRITNERTGETMLFDVLIEKIPKGGWQKAYARTLAEYIRVGDGKQSAKVLAFLLEKKNSDNMVIASQRDIQRELKVSLDVVSRTMKALQNKGMITIKKQGVYMVSPELLRHGGKTTGVIMLKVWGDLQDAKK